MEQAGYIVKLLKRDQRGQYEQVHWAVSSIPHDFSFIEDLEDLIPAARAIKESVPKRDFPKQDNRKQDNPTLVRTNNTNKLKALITTNDKVATLSKKKTTSITGEDENVSVVKEGSLPLNYNNALSVKSGESLFRDIPKKDRGKPIMYINQEEYEEGEANVGGSYTINYNQYVLGNMNTSIEMVEDDLAQKIKNVRDQEENAESVLFDALVAPLRLDTEWDMSGKDRVFIEKLVECNTLSAEVVVEKMLDNVFDMLVGKKVMRFGNVFVGLERV